MPAPTTIDELLELTRKSGIIEPAVLDDYIARLHQEGPLPQELGRLAGLMVRDGVLTLFQAEQLLRGRWRRFHIGKYKVLERIGSGGMGSVYLCEHTHMRRRVAIKVLPSTKAEDRAALERFYREARAVAALDHPNLVRAHDIDRDGDMHFLVMEYIDGSSLQDIVSQHGPLDVVRAAHYISQAAVGLQYAYRSARLVHRDIKPGNILVDRNGLVKVLDLGLARFFHDEDDSTTKKYDENVLGTADYLAPEQALDSHSVDVRADIYSLGGTFYFCLTGSTPFSQGTAAQKLIWHQTRRPTPARQLRPDVPEGMAAILERMMAKDPADRFATPNDVAEALAPWTAQPIDPPPADEMPRLCPAAAGAAAVADSGFLIPPRVPNGKPGSGPRQGTPATVAPRADGPAGNRSKPTSPGIPVPPGSIRKSLSRTMPASRVRPASVRRKTSSQEVELSPERWEDPALDTTEAVAEIDTVREAARKVKRTAARMRKSPNRFNRVALIAVPVLVAVATVALVMRWRHNVPTTPEGKGVGPGYASTIWRVSPARPDALKTVLDAILRAKAGDRIVIMDEEITERLQLSEKVVKDLTIESGIPGRAVRWVCPVNERGARQFVRIDDVEGLRLKGITFDAAGQVPTAMTIVGRCPGLLLEDVHVQGFSNTGITLLTCTGTDLGAGAITFRRLSMTGGPDCDTALNFLDRGAGRTPLCQNIVVEDSRFEGPFRAAVRVRCPLAEVRFARNRFFRAGDAFSCEASGLQSRLQLTLDSNTFCQLDHAALHLQALPLDDRASQLIIKNNLFARATLLADVDSADRMERAGSVFTPLQNVRDGATSEGNVLLHAVAMDVDLPTAVENDGTFLRYPPTSPLMQAGINGQPVGYGPAGAASGLQRSQQKGGPGVRNVDTAQTDT
jgi:serine/threonine protein kinase